MKLFSHCGNRRWEIEVDREGDRLMVRCEGETLALRFNADGRDFRNALLESRLIDFAWTRKGDTYRIVIDGVSYHVTVRDLRSERIAATQPRDASERSEGVVIRAPIPGLIRRILVKVGDAITLGQPLVTLDAMKMENEICSPIDGIVGDVRTREGQTVEKDQVLLHVAPPGG